MTPDPDNGLNRAAFRATADDPRYAGHWLARHRATEGLTDAQLAARLGTDVRGLALLALCLAPQPDTFTDDVRTISQRAGASANALAGLFRQEQSLASWSATAPPAQTVAGWLFAAHDADQPPPGDVRDDREPG